MLTLINLLVVILTFLGVTNTQNEQLTLEECFDKYERGIYPHQDDCTKFLSCATDEPLDCPAGLHFNPTEFVCDWPANAGCMKVTTPSPEPKNDAKTPSSEPDEESLTTPSKSPSESTPTPSATDKPSDASDSTTPRESEKADEGLDTTTPEEAKASTDSSKTPESSTNPSEPENKSDVSETTPTSSTSRETEKPTDVSENSSETTPKSATTPSELEKTSEPSETTTKSSTTPGESEKTSESSETTPKSSTTPSESEKTSESSETTTMSSTTPSESEKTSESSETTPKSSTTPSESEKTSESSETTTKSSTTPSESEKTSESSETTPKSSTTPSESEKTSESSETTPKPSTTPNESETPSGASETTPISSTSPSEPDKSTDSLETTPKSSTTPNEPEKSSDSSETTPPVSSTTPSQSEKTSDVSETTVKPSTTPNESEKPSDASENTPTSAATTSESERTSEPSETTSQSSTTPNESEKSSGSSETTTKSSPTTPNESESPSDSSESTPKSSTIPNESEKTSEPSSATSPSESSEATPSSTAPSEKTEEPINEPSEQTSAPSVTSPSEPEEATSKTTTKEALDKELKQTYGPPQNTAAPKEPTEETFDLPPEPTHASEVSTAGPLNELCDLKLVGNCNRPKPELERRPPGGVTLGSRFGETTIEPEVDNREPLTKPPPASGFSIKECLAQHKFGIFAHPSSPNKFFICTKSRPLEMTCPQGLEFDQAIYGCGRPKLTTTPPPPEYNLRQCLTQYPRGLFSHPTDCVKFYACTRTGPKVMSCPQGLHFNPMKLVCDWPSRYCIDPTTKTRNSILKAMKGDHIVPDLIDRCPEKLAEVAFPSGGQANLGQELTPSQTLQPPSIYWEADHKSFYTLCMVDPDVPRTKPSQPNQINHWTVGNIPGNQISRGQPLTEYLPPCPQQNSPPHRYTYMIYKQPSRIKFQEPRIPANSFQNRDGFSLRNFVERYQLGNPIAGNYFKCRWDRSVPMILQKLQHQTRPFFMMFQPGSRTHSNSFSYSYSIRM